MSAPQILPITVMQRDYNKAIDQLADGPVHLIRRSKPVAVMLTPADYERLEVAQAEVKRLQRIIQYDQDFAAVRAGEFVEG